MTENQGGSSKAQPDPARARNGRNGQRLLDRDAKSAESISQWCGGILAVLGGVLVNGHLLPGLLVIVAGALIGAVSVYYRICFGHFKRLVWGTGPVASLITASTLLIALAIWLELSPVIFPQKPPPPIPPSKPFVITPSWGAMAISGTNGFPDLVSIGTYRGGLSMRRINLLEHVTLANNRPIPTTIVGLKAFAGFSGSAAPNWQRLCEVPLRKQRLFHIAMGLSHANELSTSDSLEAHLADKTIAAHDSVSGWIAFECPSDICGNLEKIVIREANGEVTETDPFPLSSNDANLEDWIPDPTGQSADLGHIPAVPTSCDGPGTTGLMLLAPHNDAPPPQPDLQLPRCPGPFKDCQ